MEPTKKAKKEKTREPKGSAVLQGELKAIKPFLEPLWVIFLFMAAALLLIPIGGVCTWYSTQAYEVSARYDDVCWPGVETREEREHIVSRHADNDTRLTCKATIKLTIEENMEPPVYLFYEIGNMYQNHRRYVTSRSDVQLINGSNAGTGMCSPQEHYGGNSSLLIDPCGLTAWSFFNDSYALTLTRGQRAPQPLPLQIKGIALALDKKHKFANYTPQNFNPELNELRGGGTINGTVVEDEHFVNWMRLAALPTFRKPWAKIEQGLRAGDVVTVSIVNRYNTYAFKGKKSIVLATTTWLGTRNPFLGITFLVVGCMSAATGLFYFAVLYCTGWAGHMGGPQEQLRMLGFFGHG